MNCVQEVKRVMRQRANNVDLHPEIELACIDDLADTCLEKIKKGEVGKGIDRLLGYFSH